MKTQSVQWMAFINDHGARLARRVAVEGRARMEEVESLANQWQAPRREPPTSLSSPTTEHGYGSIGHVEDEHHRQYAAHINTWLEQMIQRNKIGEVVVFAPARLHGWLRKSYTPAVSALVRERTGDFAHVDTNQLAEHPAIKESVA